MMPGEDGLSLCRHLMETQQIPVILLTARGEATDRIVGLEMGAHDYIVKPFEPRELVARIRSVMPREQRSEPDAAVESGHLYAFEGWTLAPHKRIQHYPHVADGRAAGGENGSKEENN